MARYVIRSDEPVPLDICVNDDVMSAIQNVALILSTQKGACPMYRDFGLPMDFVHRPFPAAQTLAAAEITDALRAFEPRASLVDLRLDYTDEDGRYVLILEVEI